MSREGSSASNNWFHISCFAAIIGNGILLRARVSDSDRCSASKLHSAVPTADQKSAKIRKMDKIRYSTTDVSLKLTFSNCHSLGNRKPIRGSQLLGDNKARRDRGKIRDCPRISAPNFSNLQRWLLLWSSIALGMTKPQLHENTKTFSIFTPKLTLKIVCWIMYVLSQSNRDFQISRINIHGWNTEY
jgi:hypothetical protein